MSEENTQNTTGSIPSADPTINAEAQFLHTAIQTELAPVNNDIGGLITRVDRLEKSIAGEITSIDSKQTANDAEHSNIIARVDRLEKAIADLAAPHELTARVEKIEDEIRARFTTVL